MRNGTTLGIGFALIASCLGVSVLAEPVPAPIQTRYTSLLKAAEKADFKSYASFFAADYVSVDPSGQSSTRAEYMAGIHELLKGAKRATFKVHYKGAKTHNGIVNVSFDIIGKITSAVGTTTFHEVGVDSWKKVGNVWMEIKTVDSVMDVKAPAVEKKRQ